MPATPDIGHLVFAPCCKKSLQEIQRLTNMGRMLQNVLAASPLIEVLTSTKSYEALYSVQNTDWVVLAEAIKSVPAITRHQIQLVTMDEWLYRHPGGHLNSYWKAMHEHFSS